MNKELTKDVLIQIISGTISGTLSGLMVVFTQKRLEGRIKKLEVQERIKNEQEQYGGLSETLITFKKMHIDNSKQYSSSPVWREITPNGERKEEYDVAFKIIRKWLSKLLVKISKHDKEFSFIAVCTHKKNNIHPSVPLNLNQYEYLKWGKYKEIVEKSKNYFKYFDNLKKDSDNIDRCCNVVFSTEGISSFCSKVNAEIL